MSGSPGTGYVVIDGEIAARVRPGAGPPVLWIHGYTLDSGVWSALWDRLPGRSHVGIDLPGHGGSPPARPDDDLCSLADRIGRLATELEIHHVVALSFGTMLAIELAGRWPGTIGTLVLGAPSLAGGPRDPGARLLYRELVRRHDRSGPGPGLRELWMGDASGVFRHARHRPELWSRLWDTVGRHRWSELRDGSMRRLTAQDHDDAALRRIAADVLLVLGEYEMPAFVASAARIRAVVPRTRLVEVPQVGHLCLLEDPDTASALIEAHLARAVTVRGRGVTQV